MTRVTTRVTLLKSVLLEHAIDERASVRDFGSMDRDQELEVPRDASIPSAEPVTEITPKKRTGFIRDLEDFIGDLEAKPTWLRVCFYVCWYGSAVVLLILVVPLSIGLGILGAVGMRVLEGAALLAFLLSGVRWLWQRFKRR